ncbi:MAG: diacylglycerol kinase family protein [Acholeplasma sp.]|nr:diacylglycerol kinase family protein [Acholeplasma sp.]CCY27509.1 diacylglycerol kinase [Acholeplasma sp. CAG:878]
MNSEFRNKEFGFKRFLKSFKYSLDGLKYAYKNEQSMLVHLIVTIIAITLGILFKISNFEWIITIFLLSVTASLELLNTAIEAVCDMVTHEYNKLAKVAKDTASASVFFTSMLGAVSGLIIYVPKFIELF